MKSAAVVILNWNGKKLMEQFLPSLVTYTPESIADLVVADNASNDDSIEFLQKNYPQIQIITLEKNFGFAEGYNKALVQIDNKYVVLLNSDVEVTENWLSGMLDYAEKNPEITAIQPKILSYRNKSLFEYAGACGGYLDRYGYPFCRGRILNTIETDKGQYDDPAPILWASGACLFIRLEDYKSAGGLDANFFAHQEEIDLCWRLCNQGKKIISLPSSVVYHLGGGTLEIENPRKTFLNFRNNLLMIYKNTPKKRLKKILFLRFYLDIMAAIHFCLEGRFVNAKAIFEALHAFHQLKKKYQKKDLLFQSPLIYKKSLLWEYYVKRKRKFSDLKDLQHG